MLRAVILAFLLLWPVSDADAACSVVRWRFVWGVETSAHMTTDGSQCRTSVSWATGTTEVHAINIAVAPRNGSASASGRGITYRPRAGFKGEDAFVFAIVGKRHGQPSRATVRVSVRVQ
jgi:hypothetical protein